MKQNSKYVRLVEQDLALACLVDPRQEAEVDFFLRGLQESARQAERAAARASRVALSVRGR